jgi:hypothetical protein
MVMPSGAGAGLEPADQPRASEIAFVMRTISSGPVPAAQVLAALDFPRCRASGVDPASATGRFASGFPWPTTRRAAVLGNHAVDAPGSRLVGV